jgi:hypothetical protein
VRMRDEGILGAFLAYRKDGDFEGFKMRVIHKVLTPSSSREERNINGPGTSSSAATSGFIYPNTAVGGSRRRVNENQLQTSHDRYVPIILKLEQKGLFNEVTSSLLKTLILEENVEI